MTDNPYQEMAKDFFNLWQKQMTSVMGDKQFIHAMLELFKNMQVNPNAKTTTSTADPAHAPTSEHGMLADITFRVAMCEKRLSALESKLGSRENIAKETTKRSKQGSKKPDK